MSAVATLATWCKRPEGGIRVIRYYVRATIGCDYLNGLLGYRVHCVVRPPNACAKFQIRTLNRNLSSLRSTSISSGVLVTLAKWLSALVLFIKLRSEAPMPHSIAK